MKEAIPTSSSESAREDWRVAEKRASQNAIDVIAEIPDFGSKTPEERMESLKVLIEQLAAEGNKNRFIVEEVAREMKRQELEGAIAKGRQLLAELNGSEAANDEKFAQAA